MGSETEIRQKGKGGKGWTAGASVVPTIATSLPVPIGLTLWWCASLSRRLKTSVLPRLGCRNANASCPPLTLQ